MSTEPSEKIIGELPLSKSKSNLITGSYFVDPKPTSTETIEELPEVYRAFNLLMNGELVDLGIVL